MGIRLSDLLPHLLTLGLGSAVMFSCSIWLGMGHIIISILGMFWFWGAICTKCNGYGSYGCPSGYGKISAVFFRREEGDFRKAFKRNIISVALQWFIPLIFGVICLVISFSVLTAVLLGTFIIIAFIVLPVSSRGKGCARCPQRKECLWGR
ncbi:MAG: hypothetical protein U9R75_05725 [Candidatus Thermoplasmatota archaeon]|nr:hypothetical protein [Candidatus Thermoplasmatota archaeon]